MNNVRNESMKKSNLDVRKALFENVQLVPSFEKSSHECMFNRNSKLRHTIHQSSPNGFKSSSSNIVTNRVLKFETKNETTKVNRFNNFL